MIQTNLETGLTASEVRQRAASGLLNVQSSKATKTVARILYDNIFTFFNLMNAILGALILSVGSYKNALFLLVIFFNTVIGIIQELRAKRTLDRLSLLNAARVTVIRDGAPSQIPLDQVAQDDIMVLGAGAQIPCDAVVRSGMIEVNESLLTGEADAISKQPGALLMSGSFVVSGKAMAQATAVGADAYAQKLSSEAKTYRKHASQLREAMDRILKAVYIVIVPLGVGFFLRKYYALQMPAKDVVVGTVAAVLGMIPEGLVLLTSIALAVGVVNLGKRNTLVRELFCIETLARVSVMCLDKTGTLTEGSMQVSDVIPLRQDVPVDEIMGNLVRVLQDENETFLALKRRFPEQNTMNESAVLAFSSARKYSGAKFDDLNALLVGAYEFLVPADRQDPALKAQIELHASQGVRVLALAYGELPDLAQAQSTDLTILALILLSDVIRPEAADSLRYFREQGTKLIIISGDHPATVSSIAAGVGFPGADRYVDCSTLATEAEIQSAIAEYNVFGRVNPLQKKQIVQALKASGHTVAMVGDGVNDVPAMKTADCSIAISSGADAAKQCANLVLLDSNFASMPHVVHEGRRVINNIQSASSLFLVKTLFSMILTAVLILFSSAYPFMPIHLTLISACAVGIPTFIFALEPNFDRIGDDFFGTVLQHALTGSLAIVLFICVSTACCAGLGLSEQIRSTMCMITTGLTSLYLIARVYPMNTRVRKCVFCAMFALFLGALLLLRGFLQLDELGYTPMILVIIMTVAAKPMLDVTNLAAGWILKRIKAHTKRTT